VWWRPLSVAIALAVPLVGLSASIRLLATGPYLRWEYARAGFGPAPGLSVSQREVLAVPSARFIVGGTSIETLAGLTLDGAPLYTEGEIAHLVDVKRRVCLVTALALLGVALCVVAAVLWRSGRYRAWPRALEAGGWLGLAIVALVGASVLVAWQWFFVSFHRLLFPPGTWQFDADSGLIRLFPERFWLDTAVAVLVLGVIGSALAVAAGRALGHGRG
jgi:integral membrane protein (TIGR01906 family)